MRSLPVQLPLGLRLSRLEELPLEIAQLCSRKLQGGGQARAAVQVCAVAAARVPVLRALHQVRADAPVDAVVLQPLLVAWPLVQQSFVRKLDAKRAT